MPCPSLCCQLGARKPPAALDKPNIARLYAISDKEIACCQGRLNCFLDNSPYGGTRCRPVPSFHCLPCIFAWPSGRGYPRCGRIDTAVASQPSVPRVVPCHRDVPIVGVNRLKRSRSLKIIAKNQLFRLAEQLLVRCEQGNFPIWLYQAQGTL